MRTHMRTGLRIGLRTGLRTGSVRHMRVALARSICVGFLDFARRLNTVLARAPHVHHMCITCASHVHHMCITCPSHAHHTSTDSPLRAQVRVIDPGSGYLCQQEPVAHFGLGSVSAVEAVTVVWPGGQRVVLEGLAVDQQHVISLPVA